MKDKTKYALFGIAFSLLNAGMIYATPTAAKGLFTVAAGKTVQFANAVVATREATHNLYQWDEVDDLISAAGSGWTVLTGDEWAYLLAYGRDNADVLNSLATVKGQYGMVILPDGWVKPKGVPTFSTDYTTYGYGANVYTTDTWALMEESGAVFLPCGGNGHENDLGEFVFDEDEWEQHGAYWASDQYSATHGNSIHFNRDEIHDFNTYAEKTRYYSVILVKEVTPTILDEVDEIDDYTTKWTAAKTKDFAIMNRTMAKDGTLYTLCLPFDVPDVDASPLAGAEIFTFDGGRVSGSAGSEVLYLYMRPIEGKRLTQGVPYLLQWENTGESITRLCFYHVENWDDNTATATDPGNTSVKCHGVYPRAQIPGYATGAEPHYNFFLGANNTLYWPDQTLYPSAKMKGFRAYFYITPGGGPSPAPSYRNMPAVWTVSGGLSSPTGIEEVRSETAGAVRSEKLLRDGQIILVIDGKMYDLQGSKIKD